jgi:hypothetical protein
MAFRFSASRAKMKKIPYMQTLIPKKELGLVYIPKPKTHKFYTQTLNPKIVYTETQKLNPKPKNIYTQTQRFFEQNVSIYTNFL